MGQRRLWTILFLLLPSTWLPKPYPPSLPLPPALAGGMRTLLERGRRLVADVVGRLAVVQGVPQQLQEEEGARLG